LRNILFYFKGFAIHALGFYRMILVGTDHNGIKRAVLLVSGMVLAVGHGATDAAVRSGMLHNFHLLMVLG
jgi:hypothetical protein